MIRVPCLIREKYENIQAVRKSILQKSQLHHEENRIGIPKAIIFHIVIYKERILSLYSGIIELGLRQHSTLPRFPNQVAILAHLDESNA